MKPLGVLVLVLVAVGGLFFAITQLGGGGDDDSNGNQAIENTAEPVAPQAEPQGELATPAGTREVAEIAAAPTQRESLSDGVEQYDNVLSGLVLNDAQQPIADATVVLTRAGMAGMLFVNEEMDRSKDRSTTTNESGKYIFTNVEPFDRYSIEANAEGYSQAELPNVNVDTSGEVNLQPVLLAIGASLSGVVKDSAGNTVPNATLQLDGMFSTMDGQPAADSLIAVSDATGTYLIPNVPPGNRSLTIRADGYANQGKGGLVFRGEEPLTMDITLEIAERICGKVISNIGKPVEGAKVLAMSFSNSNRTCRDNVVTDENGEFCLTSVAAGQYTIAVTANGYRRGNQNRVRAGGASLIIELDEQGVVNGRVVAGDGPAPTPYLIQLRQTHPGNVVTSAIGKPVTFNEEDGSFSVECTQSGTFLVEARAPGFSPSFSAEFRFTIGQPMNGVVVHLTSGGSISATVVDSEGNPVSRPRVTTHDNTWTNSLFDRALGDQFPTNVTKTSTNGNGKGKFILKNLRPDTYQLRIRAPGFCEATMQDVFVTEGKDNAIGNIQLIRGGEVSGTVIDLAGQPVAGAKVRLSPESGGGDQLPRTYEGSTDASGKYTLKNIFPGKYKLSAAAASGATNFMDTFASELDNMQLVQIRDGETQHFELKIDS